MWASWRQDGGVEGHELIYSDENTKSQLTVDQPLTKNYKKKEKLEPIKKDILHTKTKKKAQGDFESKSHSVVSDSLRSHGLYSLWILQSRILEWVAIPFSRGSSQPRDRTQFSHIAGRFFTSWATREAQGDGRRGEIKIKSNPISTGWVTHKLENNYAIEVLLQ